MILLRNQRHQKSLWTRKSHQDKKVFKLCWTGKVGVVQSLKVPSHLIMLKQFLILGCLAKISSRNLAQLFVEMSIVGMASLNFVVSCYLLYLKCSDISIQILYVFPFSFLELEDLPLRLLTEDELMRKLNSVVQNDPGTWQKILKLDKDSTVPM